MRFECEDVNKNGKTALIGAVEITLAEIVQNGTLLGLEKPLVNGKEKKNGSLVLVASEKQKAKNNVIMDIQPKGLPNLANFLKCTYSTTYYLEIYKGQKGQNAKIYESEWFVGDISKRLDIITLTDSLLCNCNKECPITFKFISRNHFEMVNTEIASLTTNLNRLSLLEIGA